MMRRMKLVWSLLIGVSFLGVSSSYAQRSYASGQNIAPAYEGWERNGDGSFNLVFGYMNRNWEEEIDIPIGPDNSFSPGTADRGQPLHFLPRRSRFVFRVRVPADFGEQELVWTLTSNGQTERAYGTLKRDYFIDDLVVQANFGASGAAGATPESEPNEVPMLTVEGSSTRVVGIGDSLTLTAVVTDDGLPSARGLAATSAHSTGRITTDSATGLRMSWFVYRGGGQVTFDPPQTKVWEDTREGNDSPWSPGWTTPPAPEDSRWSTVVTFSEPGTYVLRALAHDGGLAVHEDIVVTVNN